MIYDEYCSNILPGTSNNFALKTAGRETTYLSFLRVLGHGRQVWRFEFSNLIDSTFDDGSFAWANRFGGEWTLGLRVGHVPAGAAPQAVSGLVPVTFGGLTVKTVLPGEIFSSDEAVLDVPEGEELAAAMTVKGDMIPGTPDSIAPAFSFDPESGIGAAKPVEGACPHPNFAGILRDVRPLKAAFLGDSITQGCGTRVGMYESWAARIGGYLHSKLGAAVWNLGLGFGRAYDAATDSAWLARAKHSDIVFVCFGVNDIFHGRDANQIFTDLVHIDEILSAAGCSVIQLTIPPFNMTGRDLDIWRDVNGRIRKSFPQLVDFSVDNSRIRCFDIAKPLAEPENDSVGRYGPHPDGNGGAAVLEYFKKTVLGE